MTYRLNVIAHGKPGFYESDTLLGLVIGVARHRLGHFIRNGKWSD